MKINDYIKLLTTLKEKYGDVEVSYSLEENLTSEGRIRIKDSTMHYFIQQPGTQKRREVKKKKLNFLAKKIKLGKVNI